MATDAKNQETTVTPAGGNDGGNNGDPKKPTFGPEEQEFINRIIAREKSAVEQKFTKDLDTMRSEMSTLQSQLADAKKALDSTKRSGNDTTDEKNKVDELTAQMEEIKRAASVRETEARQFKELAQAKDKEAEKAREEVLNLRKSTAIQSAASKQNFFNLEAVQVLTEKFVKYDQQNSRFVVMNEQGQERLNASFEPMSLEEYYAEFAEKNKYLVRGDVRPGAGSSESARSSLNNTGKISVEQVFGPKSSAKLANDLAKSDIREYHRLKEVARTQGLIS